MKKKVMIGTLYSGEGDFDRCRKSVEDQNYPSRQFIISNQPEADAHMQLYKRFKDSNYDFLIKLDADMVFIKNSAVRRMVKLGMKYDKVSFQVQDYFTNSKFFGVHLFSKHVKWKWGKFISKNIKPDRLDNAKKKVSVKEALVYHCYYPNIRQSFHYGFHRIHKGQNALCQDVVSHFESKPDDSYLRAACLGIYAAIDNQFAKSNDYNTEFEDAFSQYSVKEFPNLIGRLRNML